MPSLYGDKYLGDGGQAGNQRGPSCFLGTHRPSGPLLQEHETILGLRPALTLRFPSPDSSWCSGKQLQDKTTTVSPSAFHGDQSLQLNLSSYTPLLMPNCNLPRGLPTRKSLWMLESNQSHPGQQLCGQLWAEGGKLPKREFRWRVRAEEGFHKTQLSPYCSLHCGVPSPFPTTKPDVSANSATPVPPLLASLLSPARCLTIHICFAEC